MHAKHKIGPFVAALICINTMMGAGLFINPKPLTIIAGPLGFLGYVLAATILLPIIYCTASLASLHAVSGGVYVFSKTYLGPAAGFISGWAYFVGKTTSAALLMHKFVQFMQASVPALAAYSTLGIDFFLLFVLIALNIAGVFIGGRSQYLFIGLRLVPLLTVFLFGFLSFDSAYFIGGLVEISHSAHTVPIAVFGFLGFEIICAVGHMIKDSEKNIKRVIISSFLFVATMNTLFQLFMFGALGHALREYNSPVLELCSRWFTRFPWAGPMINGFVFISILGTCFGMLTSNCWNLYTLAHDDNLPGKKLLTKISRTNVPWVALLLEGVLACLFLLVSSRQIPLQNMAVFAQATSYLFTVISTLYAVVAFRAVKIPPIVPVLGIASATFVLYLCMMKIIASGISFSFVALFMFGIVCMILKRFLGTSRSISQN